MFSWRKLGHIYNPCDDVHRPAWRWNFAQGVNTIIFDDYVRVYFCCREKPNENGQTVSRICYADLDIGDLTLVVNVSDHPVMDVGGLGCFDEFGMYPFTVVRSGEKIYGYYGGVTRCESVPFNTAIGGAISVDDGETFIKMGRGPVISYSHDEPFIIGSPKVRIFEGKWYMFYAAGREWVKTEGRPEVYYKLRMAISDDGENWEKIGKDIISDRLGVTEAQASGDVTFKNGKYHMFFCYRKNLDFRRNAAHSYRIGYAVSEDLFTWVRRDDLAAIDISQEKDAFDNEMVAYPHLFEVGGKIYMVYLGNEVGKNGFGLAVLEGELM